MLAMQKVVGSSPIIRFAGLPATENFWALLQLNLDLAVAGFPVRVGN